MKRALILLLAAIASAFILKGPRIEPAASVGVAGAEEVKVYRLTAEELAFPIPAGVQSLRVLVNFDLPAGQAQPVDYSLRLRLSDEPAPRQVALRAKPPSEFGHSSFYLGASVRPAPTREVLVERVSSAAATLTLALQTPGSASVRVLAPALRPLFARQMLDRRLTKEARAALARRLGLLPWAELDEQARAELLDSHWARLTASAGAQARRLYLVPAGDVPGTERGAAPLGQDVPPGREVAFTLRGPGVVALSAAEGTLEGEAVVRGEKADGTPKPLHAPGGGRVEVTLPGGLVTLTVRPSRPLRLIATTDRRELLLDAPVDNEAPFEVRPLWIRESVVQANTWSDAPAEFDLRGRGDAELRVSARALLPSSTGSANLAVHWRMVDRDGREVGGGVIRGDSAAQPSDRVEGEPANTPGAPVAAVLWPPRAAATLEVRSETPALVAAFSPGAPAEPPSPGAFRLLHEAKPVPGWIRISPVNAADLAANGRVKTLALAERLERTQPSPRPVRAWASVAPSGMTAKFTLLIPARASQAPLPAFPYWSIPERRSVSYVAAEGARSELSITYAGDPSTAGAEAVVELDGRQSRHPLYVSRGQLSLADSPGPHQLTVGVPGARLFINRPVEGARMFRAVAVYGVGAGGPVAVPVRKRGSDGLLGIAFYFDGDPGDAQARVEIDGGRHAGPSSSTVRTRLLRTEHLRTRPSPQALYLTRSAPEVFEAQPLFVKLGNDLGAGSHTVRVTLLGSRSPAFVRFFQTSAETATR